MCCTSDSVISNNFCKLLNEAGENGIVVWKLLTDVRGGHLTSPCLRSQGYHWTPGENFAKPNGQYDPLLPLFKYDSCNPAGIHVFINAQEVMKMWENTWKGCDFFGESVIVPVRCFEKDFIRAGVGNFDLVSMEQAVFKKVTLLKEDYLRARNGTKELPPEFIKVLEKEEETCAV